VKAARSERRRSVNYENRFILSFLVEKVFFALQPFPLPFTFNNFWFIVFGKLFRPSDTSAFFFLIKLFDNQAFINFYARANSDFSSKLTQQQLNLKIHKESIKSESVLPKLRARGVKVDKESLRQTFA
jgi:hypothetical protein